MTKDFGKPKKQFKKPYIWWAAMKPPVVGWLHARLETKTRGDGDDVTVVCIGIRSGSAAIG